MVASKEITYLDANTAAGYFVELGNLVDKHLPRLSKRGTTAEAASALRGCGEEVQNLIVDHLTAQMTTNTEGADTRVARALVNEWIGLMKDGGKLAFRSDKTGYALMKHDLRIGVAYQNQRVAAVLAEARSMLPGVKKHRTKLLTRLTAEEIDSGERLINELAGKVFTRVGALNEQIEKKYQRTKAFDRGMTIAREVLDAADLEFRAKEDEALRDLFFGLDERMSTAVKEAEAAPVP